MPNFIRIETARALSVLPAAGAYDSSPTAIGISNFDSISFGISYTRGGAAGAVAYKIEYCFDDDPATGTWYQVAAVELPAVVAGSDAQGSTQKAELNSQATSASAQNYMTDTFDTSGKWIRISLKETGNVGSPGTASVRAVEKGFY